MFNEDTILFALATLCGVFCLVCAAKDYYWFMNHRRAQFLVKLMGRGATRFLYMGLGAVLIVGSLVGLARRL